MTQHTANNIQPNKTQDEKWCQAAESCLATAREILGTGDNRALQKAIASTCALLTRDRSKRNIHYLEKREIRAGYVAAYLLPNAMRVAEILDREQPPLPQQIRLLDLGSGPLSATTGALLSRYGSRLTSAHAVDINRPILRAGAEVVSSLHPELKVQTVQGSVFGRNNKLPKGKFDLVILSNLLSEVQGHRSLAAERCQRFVQSALRLCSHNGCLLILEPGTRVAARTINLVRDHWQQASLVDNILAPCTGSQSCPMSTARSWCHTVHPLPLPRSIRSLRQKAGLRSHSFAYCYLLYGKPVSHPEPQARVVSDTLQGSQKKLLYLCTKTGLSTVDVSSGKGLGHLQRCFRGELIKRPQPNGTKPANPRAKGAQKAGKPGSNKTRAGRNSPRKSSPSKERTSATGRRTGAAKSSKRKRRRPN